MTNPSTNDKAEARREAVTRIVERLQKTKRFRLNRHCQPNWSPEELQKLPPFANRIAAGEISYYAACTELRTILKNRTWEAIRSKLKVLVNYGRV